MTPKTTAQAGISIVIAAFNEEKVLPATLAAANEARRALAFVSPKIPTEIVVVNNASTDQTTAVAISHGAIVGHVFL